MSADCLRVLLPPTEAGFTGAGSFSGDDDKLESLGRERERQRERVRGLCTVLGYGRKASE